MILSFLWNFRLIFIPISPLLKLDFNCSTIFALSGVDKFPGNIRFDEDALKTSWRRLSSSSSEDVFKMSWRRLDQDKYIRLNYYSSSEDIFKKSLRCLDQDQYIRLGHTSSRRLQHVFKTFSRHFQDFLKTSYKNFFKTSSRRLQAFWKRLQDPAKTSSRRIAKTSSRHPQNVFKTYHQLKPFS